MRRLVGHIIISHVLRDKEIRAKLQSCAWSYVGREVLVVLQHKVHLINYQEHKKIVNKPSFVEIVVVQVVLCSFIERGYFHLLLSSPFFCVKLRWSDLKYILNNSQYTYLYKILRCAQRWVY